MNDKIKALMPEKKDLSINDGLCQCYNIAIDEVHAILDKHEVCVCPEEYDLKHFFFDYVQDLDKSIALAKAIRQLMIGEHQ